MVIRGRPGVLFDLDGTLVDTNYLHALAWSRAFRDCGEWAPMNAIHRLVGVGGDQLVPRILGRDKPEISDARASRYRELAPDIRGFPGAAALLRQVRECSLAVVLATSSPKDEISLALSVLDADEAIDGLTTADDVPTSKPAPDVFLKAMDTFGLDPRLSIAVGDSIWDVEAARAAGIACVAVESGGFSQHELSEAGARQVYRDVREIVDQYVTSPLAALGT